MRDIGKGKLLNLDIIHGKQDYYHTLQYRFVSNIRILYTRNYKSRK